MKTPKEIIQIIESIKDVRLDKDGCSEVKFVTNFHRPDSWETNTGFGHNCFTQKLFLLIEDALKVNVE